MNPAELELLSIPVRSARTRPACSRVGNSRVLLDLVLRAFHCGATPESIVQACVTSA